MTGSEFHALGNVPAALLGLNTPVGVILTIAAITADMRQLPWEKVRSLRLGFFLVAPLVASGALIAAPVGGVGAFHYVTFGIFDDKVAMPWLTLLPALLAGLLSPGTGAGDA